MKDLKVRFWKNRGYYVINAARIGLNERHGKFETEDAAKKEAEILKAKFLLKSQNCFQCQMPSMII